MVYRGKHPQLYVLLRYQREYHWKLYDVAKEYWVMSKKIRCSTLLSAAKKHQSRISTPTLLSIMRKNAANYGATSITLRSQMR